jgi:hypothetical protein
MESLVVWLLAFALIFAVLLALVLNRRLAEFRKGAGGSGGASTVPASGPLPKESHPRQVVNVHADLVGTEVRLRVDPWVVDVENGKPLKWVLQSNDVNASLRIRPKDAGKWPFPDPLPDKSVPPGQPFPAGNVKGDVGTWSAYSILVRIDGRDLDIDPEIFICF